MKRDSQCFKHYFSQQRMMFFRVRMWWISISPICVKRTWEWSISPSFESTFNALWLWADSQKIGKSRKFGTKGISRAYPRDLDGMMQTLQNLLKNREIRTLPSIRKNKSRYYIHSGEKALVTFINVDISLNNSLLMADRLRLDALDKFGSNQSSMPEQERIW